MLSVIKKVYFFINRIIFKMILWVPLAVAIMGLLLFSIIWIDAKYLPWQEKKREREFNEKLDKLNVGEEIFLRDLTNFTWDKVCYLGYGEEESVKEYLLKDFNINYDGYIPSQHCDSFARNDVVFIDNNKNVKIMRINNCYISVGGIKNDYYSCYSKNAKLRISNNKNPFGEFKQINIIESNHDGH